MRVRSDGRATSSAESDELIVLLIDNELGRATTSRDDGGYKDKDDQDGEHSGGKVGIGVHCYRFGGMSGEEEKTCDDAGCYVGLGLRVNTSWNGPRHRPINAMVKQSDRPRKYMYRLG